ncbi:probable shikimate 5-dehydrogenase [Cephalotrichum gorgonifer]|uniref:Probable shikimate 5-dehydrogenase n=1 Tax=Cephalotrichum gorgonifer TaxID=2041049 RepID=A0AAE8SX51_9PEZI|nr:probable shikimate 5-dehydrogenase [Cephalotrichum gorgonifer]
MAQEERKTLHLVGTHVTHSIAKSMHNYIAQSLSLPWTFYSTTCPAFSDVLDLLGSPSTAGLVVTMPYKNAVMKHVDELDDLATIIGACNCIYYKEGPTKRLSIGSNTDWNGIIGSLLEGDASRPRPSAASPGSALVIGAGGASRAAVYTLATHLHCPTIYILNRDDQEVVDLIADSEKVSGGPRLIHVKSVEEAQRAGSPYYVLGTVPDMEPVSQVEKDVVAMLDVFLSKPEKGILLDLCFKPRITRMMKAGARSGWKCVEGIHVIGHQVVEQWRLWVGSERLASLDQKAAWAVLLKAADDSDEINF